MSPSTALPVIRRLDCGTSGVTAVAQAHQLRNPDARVTLEEAFGELLERHASSHQGIKTGDDAAKRRCFWEQPVSTRWEFLQGTVSDTSSYGGMHSVLDWAHQGADSGAAARRRCVEASRRRHQPDAGDSGSALPRKHIRQQCIPRCP